MTRKLFTKMATAQIMSAMTSVLCPLIDSIVISRMLGVDSTSAYGLSSPVIILLSAIGTMLVTGVQVQLGKSLGNGEMDSSSDCFSTSLVLSLFISAITLVLIFPGANVIIPRLGTGAAAADNITFVLTRDYLRGYTLCIAFFFLNQIMVAFLQSMGQQKLLLVSVVAMIVSDVIFDFLSIYLSGGIYGIGIASGLSFVISSLVCCIYFFNKDCPFRFSIKRIRSESGVNILRSGSPVIVNQVFFTIRVLLFNLIFLNISGTPAVAAFAVITAIENLIYSIAFGAGAVTLMLTSLYYSDEDRTSILSLIRVMVSYPLILSTVTVIFVELSTPLLISLFLPGGSLTFDIAVTGLRLFSIASIPSIIDNIFKNYYQGIRHTFITNLISFLESLGILIPCVLIFGRFWGITGFWIGTIVAQFLTFIAMSSIIWKKAGRISFSADVYSYLDRDFGADPDECMEISMSNEKEVIAASEKIVGFCREKGMKQKTSMLIGLCVEEIAGNVIEHGFSKKDLSDSVNFKLLIKEDSLILRFRDNGSDFDPTKYLELHQDSDPASHIGLKMIMRMVSDASYVNTLGLNNLTLTVTP